MHNLFFFLKVKMLAFDLELLGFKFANPVRMDARLFAKPNSKLLEDILYFLFTTLSPNEAALRFRDSWPVASPQISKRFRVDVLKWFEDIGKTGVIPRECLLRKSSLDESAGERLEISLSKFAEFLIQREAQNLASDSNEKDGFVINGHVYACGAALSDSCHQNIINCLKEIDNKSVL